MNTTKDLAHYKITIGVEKLLKTVGGDTGNGGAAAAALPRARSNYKRTVTMTMSVSHLGYVLDHAALSSATKANAALKGSKVFKSMNVFSGLGRLIPAAWIEPGMYMMVNDAPGKPMQLGEVIENELVTSDG